MHYYRSISILLIILFGNSLLVGQAKKIVPSTSEITYAVKLGEINPLSKTKSVSYNLSSKRDRKDFKIPKNFAGRFPRKTVDPAKQNKSPDPLRQLNNTGGEMGKLETVINMEGLPTMGTPSDPTGDVGLNYYVQGINATEIGIFKKNGDFVSKFEADVFWSDFGLQSAGDPIILFDQDAKRWLITEFPLGRNFLLVAISQTDDPLGDYDTYRFSTPVFPDYPKYAVWDNEYTVTYQSGDPSQLSVLFINKSDLLAGVDQARIVSTEVTGSTGSEQSFLVTTPVDWSGSIKPPAQRGPMSVSLADASWTLGQSEDLINVHSYEVDWNTNEAITSLTQVPVSDYNSFACDKPGSQFQCIPQKGGSAIDGLPEIIPFQPHYRNFGSHESMVFNFITDAGDGDGNIRAGIRWIELRRNIADDWSLYQEGTYAPDDGLHRFMGSIAIDKEGNLGLAYSCSSALDYIGLRYTGRNAGDSLGVMTFEEEIAVEGTNTIRATFGHESRYGDYPHMTIDPVDERTFWFTSEYAARGSSTSRIIAFKASSPDYDLAPDQLVSPSSAIFLTDSEEVQLTVKNIGNNALDNYVVGYQIENQNLVSETITSTIQPAENYTHTFATKGDFSKIGVNRVKIFTHHPLDLELTNDTIISIVENFAQLDLAPDQIETSHSDGRVCGNSTMLTFRVKNLGQTDVASFTYEIILNGQSFKTVTETLDISKGANARLSTELSGLIDGTNEIEVILSAPNGQLDQITSNDRIIETIKVLSSGEIVTVDILTDFFPNETSWAIFDLNDEQFYTNDSGLEFLSEQHVLKEVCLNTDSCYKFVIYDVVGDGLTSQDFYDGSYQIRNEAGQVISGNLYPDFGLEEENYFCVNDDCRLEMEVSISTDPLNDTNSILIEVTNGSGPDFQYSIDGGQNWSTTNLFENTPKGTYDVIVKDAYGCTIQNMVSDVLNIDRDVSVTAYPNPTSGIFNVELSGYNSNTVFLPVEILNSDGSIIQRTHISKYSDKYKGMISLYHYPSGSYLIKLNLEGRPKLLQIEKI